MKKTFQVVTFRIMTKNGISPLNFNAMTDTMWDLKVLAFFSDLKEATSYYEKIETSIERFSEQEFWHHCIGLQEFEVDQDTEGKWMPVASENLYCYIPDISEVEVVDVSFPNRDEKICFMRNQNRNKIFFRIRGLCLTSTYGELEKPNTACTESVEELNLFDKAHPFFSSIEEANVLVYFSNYEDALLYYEKVPMFHL